MNEVTPEEIKDENFYVDVSYVVKKLCRIADPTRKLKSNKDYYNPQIVCADGFSMSVQARRSSYCTPRRNEGPHTELEGGFPSSKPLSTQLLEHAELGVYTDDYTKTVYPYVPREVFEREFELHGGIVKGSLPY